jgi:peptidoglycan hydrolase-like protein with peptidoglycan-binding domain
MAKRRKSIIPGMSFSWKRALGVTSVKRKFSRATGIPTTRSGRQRKAARLMGCLMPISIACCVVILMVLAFSIAFATSTDYQYAQVATSKGPLNMRETPSSKADIIEKIPKDTIIAVGPYNDVWRTCTYNGKDGFVMTEYLIYMDISQFRALALNDSGQDVLALKEKLKELYFFDKDTVLNDSYDSDTETTVKQFQLAQGMEDTGIASPELQALLYWGDPKNNLPTKKMTVTISSSCSGYNHVGENWSRYYSINGKSVSSGDTVDIILGESVSIYSKVTEKDSSPDVGSVKEDIEITQEYFDGGFTVAHKVSVKENRGQYAGNKAVWTITYKFAP